MKAWSYLSSGFTNIPLPSNIQKRLYKFLLRKALGQFLATDLDVENFDVELLNGSLELRDLELNLDAINDLLMDTSFMVVQGRVGSISACLPWFNWSGETILKLQGLNLTLKPISEKRTRQASETEDENSPVMSSSLHFADDFLKTEMEPDQDQELYKSIQQLQDPEEIDMDYGAGGLQVLTRVIDKMLAKVKVDVIDTVIHVIHPSAVTLTGDLYRPGGGDNKKYSLDIELPKISYFDETPSFADKNIINPTTVPTANMVESSILIPSSGDEIIKIITITSPQVWLRSCHIPSLYSQSTKSETTLDNGDSMNDTTDLSQTEFFEASEGDSNLFLRDSIHSSIMSGSITPRAFSSTQHTEQNDRNYEALLFTTMDKDNWIRLKARPTSSINTQPTTTSAQTDTKNIDIYFSHIRTIITPKQLAFLMDILSATNTPNPSISTTMAPSSLLSHHRRPSANLEQVVRDQRRPLTADLSPPHTTSMDPYQDQNKRKLSSLKKSSPESPSSPGIRIKLQVPLMEHFFLYSELSSTSTTSTIDQPTSDTSHLKIWIHQLIIRLQQYPSSNNNFYDNNRSNIRRVPLPRIDTAATSSNQLTPIASVLDFRIHRMGLTEWVIPPLNSTTHSTPAPSVTRKYNCYLPVLEFTDSICSDYDNSQKFPTYIHQPSTSTHGNSDDTKHRKTKKDVIRIRLEKRSTVNSDQFNETTSYDQDLTTDIQAFSLFVDPNIVDRLENYAHVLINHSRNSPTKPDTNEKISGSDQSFGQKIYEDLDDAAKEHQQRIQAKIRLAFIRIVLYAPDMSKSSTRDEFNDQFHQDVLSVDVKKITACWNTDLSKHQPQKITVDLDCINVFLKQAQDPLTRCWFTARSLGEHDSISSVSLSPSMEITLRSSMSDIPHPPSSARPGYFGTGSDIPSNLFEHLSRNETFHSEEKIHVPVEDQAESAMVFKQRTMETSFFVINCHLPTTYMTLTKQKWDKVQIIQNDLLLWQPKIVTQLEQDQHHTSTTGSTTSESFKSSAYRRYSDMESSYTSVLSQSHERLGQSRDTQTPSLFSVIAVMSDGIWDLHTDGKDQKAPSTYRLQFSDFRYFAVIKHLGMNENITTLDIEDLTLDDIHDDTRKTPLFYRTLPKSISPKRNTSMVSIFSRLTTIPELNKQNKSTSVVACNLCWRFTPDVTFLENLIGFQKAPDDLVFIDPPTQYIKVYAHVLDTSVDYKPLNIPSRAVIVVDNLQVITDILAGQPLVDIKTFIQSVDLFLVDDVNEVDLRRAHQTTRSLDARKYWSICGMSSVLTSRNLETQVKVKLDEMLAAPGIEVAILNDILTLEGCTDSFQSLNNFITYAVNDGDRLFTKNTGQSTEKDIKPATKKSAKRTHTTLLKTKENMLASLDEDAFKHRQQHQQSSSSSTTPLLGETRTQRVSMLTDLKMVEGYYSGSGASSASSPHAVLRPRKPRRKHYQHQKAPEEIVRILVNEIQELDIVENYYGIDKKKVGRKSVVDVRRSTLSLRVKDVDIIWKLYNGYDWTYVRSSTDLHSFNNLPSSSTPLSSSATNPTTTTAASAGSSSSTSSRRPSSRPSSSSSTRRYSSTVGIDTFSRNTSHSELRSMGNHSPSLADRLSGVVQSSPPYASHLDKSPAHYYGADIGTSSSFDDYRHSPSSSLESRKSATTSTSTSTSATPRQRRHQQEHHHRHHRRASADMELRIEGICFELDKMLPEEQTCLHSHLEIRDIEIVDNIKTSAWDTFFGCLRQESPSALPRETDSCMLVVDLMGTRPVAQDTTVEYRIRIKTLPMRLYIDQDALNFLTKFFTFNSSILRSTNGAKAATSSPTTEASTFYGGDGYNMNDPMASNTQQQHQDTKDEDLFFQSVEIYPIDLKIDYKPKYFNYDNIKEGQYAELANVFQLEGAKLNLSAVKLNGINGIQKLLDRLSQEWVPHIKNTQLLHMLSGVSPIRSMVNLGSGVADLIILPIQQYRKDGRVIKGIQRGTQSFARSTAMEVIKLSSRLASGTQVIFEHADGFLSSGTTQQYSSRSGDASSSINAIMDPRDGMVSSSSSPLSTVIGSRTSEDMVFIFTDRNVGMDED
ncbi:hypothetical protein BC941DRAFT_516431 [Chlamydoabsidia padenii]|nr:hypothetical protein BC941DRAFT_516431 [Chlamydoabsidia padenii]